jgi:hypothetical protein
MTKQLLMTRKQITNAIRVAAIALCLALLAAEVHYWQAVQAWLVSKGLPVFEARSLMEFAPLLLAMTVFHAIALWRYKARSTEAHQSLLPETPQW